MKTHIVIHHSLTSKNISADKAERSFDNNHQTRGFSKSKLGWFIGYQYVIYGNGELRQYRLDDEIGSHTKEQNMNNKSIGICLSGNFDIELPNQEQINTLKLLLIELVNKYNISPNDILPHRYFAPYKSCYGTKLDDNWGKNLLLSKKDMFVKNIVVLLSGIEGNNLVSVKTGINNYIQKVNTITNGELKYEVSFFETSRKDFHTIDDHNLDGSPLVYVNANEIGEQGLLAEKILGKEFDTACLIYNTDFVIGSKPTNPVENPIILNGFNPIQIPLNWIIGSDFASEMFFAHEDSHSNVHIINTEANLSLPDKTHAYRGDMGYKNQVEYYLALLLELKQYWKYLITPKIERINMTGYKHPTEKTVFVIVGSNEDDRKYIPLADWQAFISIGGNEKSIKTLSQQEYDMLVRQNKIINSVLFKSK